MRSSYAEGGVGTRTAAVAVVGGDKWEVGIEDIGDGFFEALDEMVGVDGDVADGLSADDERGVVALGSGMLDEKQRRTHGLSMFLTNDVTIEEGLEVVIAVVGNLGRVEDRIDIGHGTEMTGTGLVVDDTDAFLAADGIGDAVETVDVTTDDGLVPWHVYTLLKTEDGEGGQTTVGLDEQTHILDNHLTVDDLEAVEDLGGVIQFTANGGIDGTADGAVVVEQGIEQGYGDATIGKLLVKRLGSFMENVSEETVVDEILVGVVGLLQVANVTVEEA